MKKLSDKHEKFCLAYVLNFNATEAYSKIYGTPAADSRKHGARLMAKDGVKTRIAQLTKKTNEKMNITREKVVQEIANIAFSHIGLVCVFDASGALTLKTAEEMGENIRALQSVSQDETHDSKGNIIKTKTRFAMHDKLKALELLSKHLGLLDGNDQTGKNTEAINKRLSENLDRIEEKLSQRGNRSR